MQQIPVQIVLNTGCTVQESQNYLTALKHAMCCAMMHQVQSDNVNECFSYYQTIYLEAHHLHQLQQSN